MDQHEQSAMPEDHNTTCPVPVTASSPTSLDINQFEESPHGDKIWLRQVMKVYVRKKFTYFLIKTRPYKLTNPTGTIHETYFWCDLLYNLDII